MKLLFCHNSYQIRSGEDIAAENDLKLLRERGVEVLEYKRSSAEVEQYGFFGKIALLCGIPFRFKTYREVRSLIRRERPDLALIQNVYPLISPSIYYALAKERVPIVQLAYNYRLMCANGSFFTQNRTCRACLTGSFFNAIRYKCFRESRILSALYAFSIALHKRNLRKKISAYISPAHYVIRSLREAGYPADRMYQVFNPFDVAEHSPELAHDGFFLFFGRLVREKGIFTLLEAASRYPDLRIVIVGKGDAQAEMERILSERQLKNVQFLGPRYGDELTQVLRGAAAVICPVEWFEVSPLVIYQAFSCAKPVISSRIDPIPELVSDYETGLLFRTGDPDDLARKMHLLLNDESLRLKLAGNAREMALREFTREGRFQKLITVFQSLVSTRT